MMYFSFSRKDLLACFSLNLGGLIYVLNTPGLMPIYLPGAHTLSDFTIESIQLKTRGVQMKPK